MDGDDPRDEAPDDGPNPWAPLDPSPSPASPPPADAPPPGWGPPQQPPYQPPPSGYQPPPGGWEPPPHQRQPNPYQNPANPYQNPPVPYQPPPGPGWGPPPPYGGYGGYRPLPKAGSDRTGPLPLHPMSVGDILDGTFKLLKANFKTVLLVTAAVIVPVQVISAFFLRSTFEVGFFNSLSTVDDPTVTPAYTEESLLEPLLGLGTLLIASLLTPFVAGAVSRVVAASYLGSELSAADALRVAVRRFPALLAAFLLVHLAELIGGIACFLPGLAFMALFVLVAPAIAVEEIGPLAAMSRSWNLVKPRFWPVLGVALLTGLIANLLGQVLATPAAILGYFGGPLAWIALATSQVLGQLISLPIVTIAATLMYFDARIRHEGFDLQVMAAELGRGAPVA